MLTPARCDSGGFHFVGKSSCGKTTALSVANSVWGLSAPLVSWRSTDNALEGLAQKYNDTLLCLDELAQIEPQAAGKAAYMLSNSQGKSRAKTDGTLREPPSWKILFLTSGEISLADKMTEDGRQRVATAGQAERLIEIPADAGGGVGYSTPCMTFQARRKCPKPFAMRPGSFTEHRPVRFWKLCPVIWRRWLGLTVISTKEPGGQRIYRLPA